MFFLFNELRYLNGKLINSSVVAILKHCNWARIKSFEFCKISFNLFMWQFCAWSKTKQKQSTLCVFLFPFCCRCCCCLNECHSIIAYTNWRINTFFKLNVVQHTLFWICFVCYFISFFIHCRPKSIAYYCSNNTWLDITSLVVRLKLRVYLCVCVCVSVFARSFFLLSCSNQFLPYTTMDVSRSIDLTIE